MADVYRLADRFRKSVLDRERDALRGLLTSYGRTYEDLNDEVGRWTAKIAARADELGVPIADVARTDPSWPFRLSNLEAHQAAIGKRMGDLAAQGVNVTEGLQGDGIEMGLRHARDLAAVQGGSRIPAAAADLREAGEEAIRSSWQVPHEGAFEALVGQTADGTPLTTLFQRAAGDAAVALSGALTTGFALGQNPRVIARAMKQHLGGNLSRALRIARTETVRAYRLGQIESFRANPKIVPGWIWHSALDNRTCLSCVLKHGTRYDLDAVLSDHPNGRCAMVPDTADWADLADELGVPDLAGLPSTRPAVESGADWLGNQALPVQLQIMGPTRTAMYRSGDWSPDTFLTDFSDPVWGPGVRPTTLRELTGGDPDRLTEWRNRGLELTGKTPPKPPTVDVPLTLPGPDVPEAVADRSRFVIQAADDAPAYVKELAEEVGEGVLDPAHAMRAGAIVDGEIEDRLKKALATRKVDLPDPGLASAQARLVISKKRLTSLRRQKYGPQIIDAQAEIVREAQEEVDRLTLHGQTRSGTVAGLQAELAAERATLEAVKAEAKEVLDAVEDARASAMSQAMKEGRDLQAAAAAVEEASQEAKDAFLKANSDLLRLTGVEEKLLVARDDVAAEIVKEVLAEIRPMNQALQPWVKGGSGAVKKAFDDDVSELFPRTWLQRSASDRAMKTGEVQRGFYNHYGRSGHPELKISGTRGDHEWLDTLAHEMGHRVQKTSPSQLQKVHVLKDAGSGQTLLEVVDPGKTFRWAKGVGPGGTTVPVDLPVGNVVFGFQHPPFDTAIQMADEAVAQGVLDRETAEKLKSLAGKFYRETLDRPDPNAIPGVPDLERMLFLDWTEGQPLRHIPHDKKSAVYRPTKEGVADWPHLYAGRDYAAERGTDYAVNTSWEIMTTGLQAVRGAGVFRDYGKRIDYRGANPDLYRFVLGVLVGTP